MIWNRISLEIRHMFPQHLMPARFLSVQAVLPPKKGQKVLISMGILWDAAAPGWRLGRELARLCSATRWPEAGARWAAGSLARAQARAAAVCEGNSGLFYAN